MDAAAKIAAVLIQQPNEPQPIATAVTLAIELEHEVAAALELKLE
jgi:hypothetical protein